MKKLILLSAILLSLSACNDPYPILKKHGLSKKDILNVFENRENKPNGKTQSYYHFFGKLIIIKGKQTEYIELRT